MTYRVAVAVSGRGSNLLALGEALDSETDVEIVRVVSDRDAPALDAAARRGWATTRLPDPMDPTAWLRLLDADAVDLLVLAGYLRLIPPEVVTAYRGRIINIHPALLPRHGGAGMYGERVHRAVLAAGDTTSGATVHLVDEVYDRGAVLGQATISIPAGETADGLAARVLAVEHRLLPAAVRAAARAGRPVPFTMPS